MSERNDEKAAAAASDIPRILVDAKGGNSYERLRFFGKVCFMNIFSIHFRFSLAKSRVKLNILW